METTFTASVNCVGILDSQLMRRGFSQTPGWGFYSSQVPSFFPPSFYPTLRTKQESIGKSGPAVLCSELSLASVVTGVD